MQQVTITNKHEIRVHNQSYGDHRPQRRGILYCYYRSFSCFSEKIFSMVSSCRMMSIPPTRSDDNRRAAGAVVTFHHSDSIMNKQNLQEISGPAARH
jgi:hypothetical protein